MISLFARAAPWKSAQHTLLISMLTGSLGMAKTPDVALSFSTHYRVNAPASSNVDEFRPFFFYMNSPAGVAVRQPLAFTADTGTNFSVWLDRKVPPGTEADDARSLAMKITGTEDKNEKDKIFFNPVAFFSSEHVDMEEDRGPYLFSFDMMLDPSYETPSAWAMHMQVWQCCGGAPPMTLNVTPSNNKSSDIEVTLGVRDDKTQRLKGHPERFLWHRKICRGRWYNFAFRFNPAPVSKPDKGFIDLNLDGQSEVAYRGAWGYDPAQNSFEGHSVGHALGIEVGNYRKRQATTQLLYFDHIIYQRSL